MRSLIVFLNVVFFLISNSFGQSNPIGFVENKGQILDQNGSINTGVQYLFSKGPLHVQFRESGFSYEVFQKVQSKSENQTTDKNNQFVINRIDIEFAAGANDGTWLPESETGNMYNYYGQKSIESVKSFSKLIFKNAWQGVDVVFTCDDSNRIKYEIVCQSVKYLPNVVFEIRGADQISVAHNTIEYKFGGKELQDVFPKCYLKCDSEKTIDIEIVKLGNDKIGFTTESLSDCPLIIDPIPNLKWATYYGDSGSEHGYGVAADLNGDPFFCGSTTSNSNIATSGLGVYQVSYSGSDDAYLVKFLKDIDPSSKKSVRKWCTYFGDKGTDVAYNLAIDSGNNIYMVGQSYYQSTSAILYRNKLQSSHGGKMDGFVAKFNKDGKLIWSNFYGGSEDEVATSVYVGKKDTVVVIVGQTESSLTHSSNNGYKVAQSSNGGGTDAFVVQIDSAGNRKFSTYYGGSGTDIINDVSISKDSIFVVGESNSNNFSRSTGSFSGNTDGFLAVFKRDGSHISHLYLGGSSNDAVNAVNC